MQFFPIKTPLIKPNADLVAIALDSIRNAGLNIKERDILIFTEKVVATAQNRIVHKSFIKNTSNLAKKLAKKYKMEPEFVQLILNEADFVLGGVEGVLLTEIHGILVANAGIDQSNSGGNNRYVLFPANPQKTSEKILEELKNKTSLKELGVIISDSRVQPMKKGTIGVAIAVSGFEPVDDCIGKLDLFGRRLNITKRAIADDLVCGAQILMGEANEQTPIVLVRDAPVLFINRKISTNDMLISKEECLFMNVFKELKPYKKPIKKKNAK
ncbi:MAG: coenzyme F420-0:L-glutamate ligase [Promethearchaeota archaeon]